MNKRPTYAEQYEKIVQAYLKEQLQPFIECACFIGNLLNGKREWSRARRPDTPHVHREFEEFVSPDLVLIPSVGPNVSIGLHCIKEEGGGMYEVKDIIAMEQNFLRIYNKGDKSEDALFEAMCSTLEMLRQVHIDKGEIVESIPLKKRELATV